MLGIATCKHEAKTQVWKHLHDNWEDKQRCEILQHRASQALKRTEDHESVEYIIEEKCTIMNNQCKNEAKNIVMV